MKMVAVTTKACVMCGKSSVLEVEERGYHAWREGALIQRALPTLREDDRELLISGTHSKCWDQMFADTDEDGA